MKRVLIFVDWFLPGYKAGGQVQSCANLAFSIQDTIEVYLITSDRDLGDAAPYSNITTDTWVSLDKIKVYYISPDYLNYGTIRRLITDTRPDSIYLNSMFSVHFTIMAIAACVYNDHIPAKIVLAPRGMLHKGALQFKKIKKQFFLKSFRLLRLHHKILFHATDPSEVTDIRKNFGGKAVIQYLNDYPAGIQHPLQRIEKDSGRLKCIFVSRISAKKNLLYLLALLDKVRNVVIELTIVGPVETTAYWNQCQQQIAGLPANIKVHYEGAIPNQELPAIYAQHHLFVLTTYGENFGHVILESLVNGRPVLISDQTPWKNMEQQKLGWDYDLEKPQAFINAIEIAANWDQQQFDDYCNNCWHYANNYINNPDLKQGYLQLLS